MKIVATSREFLGKTEYYAIQVSVETELGTHTAQVTEIINEDANGNREVDYSVAEIDREIRQFEELILNCLEDTKEVI